MRSMYSFRGACNVGGTLNAQWTAYTSTVRYDCSCKNSLSRIWGYRSGSCDYRHLLRCVQTLATLWFRLRLIDPEVGSDVFLRNICSHTDLTALYPRSWQHSIHLIALNSLFSYIIPISSVHGPCIRKIKNWLLRRQRDGSLRPYSRFSRQEPILFS
jgi:hypothetical protein